MKIRLLCISIAVVFLTLYNSCKKETSINSTNGLRKNSSKISYAKGFDIVSTKNEKKLIIKNPYSNTSNNFEYIIKKGINDQLNVINTPIKKIVVTSTTHIPMLELLGEEKALVGFQNTDYVSSTKTRNRIDAGFVKELGNEAALNTESVLELKPDAVIGFTMDNYNKTFNLIEKHGIPVIINGDWREETPLGRAEWIKFFGVLFNKERLADSIFNTIEVDYLAAKRIAKENTKYPSILSGAIMRNDIWSLPAGESFVSQFLLDANVNYLWKDSKGKGSLQLSFESVLDKAQHADYWIAPGYFSSKAQLLENNPHYKNFTAFKNNNIFTASTKRGVTGGVVYYELGPTRPDLILQDIIKITNPELLPNYTLTFFEQMK
jgi:iron complex transport system substrate-binding protein